MQVILGYHFDVGAWPDALLGKTHSEGVQILGPGGFLGLLETRLGLPTPTVNEAVRVARWYRAMQERLDDDVFYATSFARNGWDTAQRVLAMRDELAMTGWFRRSPTPDTLPRLRVLAELEQAAQVAPGFGDRLWRVLAWIERDGVPGLREVKLQRPYDSQKDWPAPWPTLFDALRDHGVSVILDHPSAPPAATSTLQAVAQALSYPASPPVNEALLRTPDASLRIVRTDTRLQAVDSLTALLLAAPHSILIRDPGDVLLDAALCARGLPPTGCAPQSPARAAISLLRLFLLLRLCPPNMETLYQFLRLPLSPVSRKVSGALAAALEKEPACGEIWRNSLERLEETHGKEFLDNARRWLTMSASSDAAISAVDLRAALDMLQNWASEQARARQAQSRACALLAELCRDAVQTFADAGETHYTAMQFQRMLDTVVGAGIPAVLAAAAPAPWRVIGHPGQLWQRTGQVIWWSFQAPKGSPVPDFWTQEERKCLEDAGVPLPDSVKQARLEAEAWLHPLRLAERLTLVIPRQEGDANTVPHPLYDALQAVLSDSALAALSAPAAEASAPPSAKAAPRTLPRLRPEWHIPPTRPESLSTSDLELLLNCPFAYYVQKQLRLRSPAYALQDDAPALGTLAHGIVEKLLAAPDFCTATDLDERSKETFRLEPTSVQLAGRHGLREAFLRNLTHAVGTLQQFMVHNALTFGGAEQEVVGTVSGIPCRGRLDLRLVDSGGRTVILDMKWTRSVKRYRTLLEQGKAVQLSAYAAMHGNTVDAGYLLLRQGKILLCSEKTPINLDEQWNTVEANVETIMKDWESGILRATGAVRAEDDEQQEQCRFCNSACLCGVNYVC